MKSALKRLARLEAENLAPRDDGLVVMRRLFRGDGTAIAVTGLRERISGLHWSRRISESERAFIARAAEEARRQFPKRVPVLTPIRSNFEES